MPNVTKFLEKNTIWILLILSIPAVWVLAVPGFFGASDDLHIAWLFEMDKIIKLGQIPPRFVPDLSYQFGYPLFNFVFPLPFYIGEIFHLVGFNLVDSVKIVFFLSLVLSGVAMYWLLKELTSKWLALAGALIYLYTPYRSTDVYVRGAIGEALAFIFLPLIILAIVKFSQNDRLNLMWAAIGGLSMAGLILSHNISAYMFLPFAILLAVLVALFAKRSTAIGLALMVAVGLLASIYFWLPALLDSSLMKYDTVFDFADHFPTLKQLLIPYWGYGASVPGPGDGMSFFIGTVNLIILVIGSIMAAINWAKFKTLEKVILIWAGITFLASFLMMNYRSAFLWQNLPLLPYFQFPWRFLIMTTFISPLFLVAFNHLRRSNLVAGAVIMATLILSISIFRPHDFLGRTDQYFLNKYIPNPVPSEEYKLTQEEYLRLPKTTTTRPDQLYPYEYPPDKNLTLLDLKSDLTKNSLRMNANVVYKQPGILNFNKYYFPGWTAKLDGRDVTIQPGQPFGQITLAIPEGNHYLEVYFTETPFKAALDLISLFAILGSFVLIIKRRVKIL